MNLLDIISTELSIKEIKHSHRKLDGDDGHRITLINSSISILVFENQFSIEEKIGELKKKLNPVVKVKGLSRYAIKLAFAEAFERDVIEIATYLLKINDETKQNIIKCLQIPLEGVSIKAALELGDVIHQLTNQRKAV